MKKKKINATRCYILELLIEVLEEELDIDILEEYLIMF